MVRRMRRVNGVINLLPVSEILKIKEEDLYFNNDVYIQMMGDLTNAGNLTVFTLKNALLAEIDSKKDYKKKIYKINGFEFTGI